MAACGGVAMVEERALVDPSAGVLEDGYSSGEGNQQKVGTRGELYDHSMKPSSSNNEDSSNRKEDDVLESARAEMGEVREENERLKMMLQRIEKDYKCLQLRFFDILQQETTSHKPSDESNPSAEDTEEPELVSLCLGRSAPSDQHKKDHGKSSGNCHKATRENIGDLNKASLTLGLDSDSKFEVSSDLATVNPSPPEESIEEVKEEEAGETSKVAKRNNNTDEEVAQQNNNQVKRARVCVRARCDTPTMNDGCQWRKYGQKIAKGNPCPRAYYRCTVAPACPVRKQVQRCADEMSILITTYEGTHNHPLPVSATAMASTTSAAASMLLARSSTSQQQPGLGSRPATEHNVGLYDNARTNQFYYLPNSSATTFPTITLDLTSTPSTSSSAAFNRFSSSFASMPRFPSTSSLSFSSTESNILPAVWSSNNGYQNFSTLPFANTSPAKLIGPLSTALGKQHQEQTYQPYINKERNHQAASTPQALTETLTKAITSDPSFRTVIALAITSMIGSGGASGNQGPVESLSQNLKLGEPNQGIMSTTQNGKAGCAPAYFNALPSSSTSQPAGLLQPPLPFSIFNSASSTPTSKKEQKS